MSESTNPIDNPVKIGHLVTGLVFLGLAGSWALRAGGAIGGSTVDWLLPAILVGAGVIGLAAMLAGGVRRGKPGPDTRGPDRFTSHETDDLNDTSTIPEGDPR